MLVRFEPERVMPNTELASRPECLTPPPASSDGQQTLNSCCANEKDWRLLDLGNPDALEFAKTRLTALLREWGVSIFRQDFNMHPSFYWAAKDQQHGPDRVGLAELLHVEGLYSLWDHLLVSVPGLLIDNCASGGRRLDVELVSRSVVLWRSDDVWDPDVAQSVTCGSLALEPKATFPNPNPPLPTPCR